MPKSTVVVVTWRGRDLVGACLDALAAQTAPHAVLVVDNASDDGTAGVLAAHPSAPRVLWSPRNLGYAGALAAALPLIDTPYLAWLNDDAEPEPSWLAALERAMDAAPDLAATGSLLISPTGAVQSAGVRLTGLGYGYDAHLPDGGSGSAGSSSSSGGSSTSGSSSPSGGSRATGSSGTSSNSGRASGSDASGMSGGSDAGGILDVFGFCGGAALLRTDALRAAGGVPSGFFCYYEDTDTAWRLRLAGHRVATVAGARVRHRHGASSGHGSRAFHRWNERNRLLMLLRCAPAAVAVTELARFAAITAALPFRRGRPGHANHTVPLRLAVLADVLGRLPATLAQRARIGRRAKITRQEVWRRWAGR